MSICILVACVRPTTGEFCESHRQVAWRMGIDPLELEALYAPGCALCSSSEDLVLDHDHSCCPTTPACGACVRGVLCRRCNTRVAYFDDDAQLAEAATQYSKANRRIAGLAKYPVVERRGPRGGYRNKGMRTMRRLILDSKRRISLGKYADPSTDAFCVEVREDGSIVLQPVRAESSKSHR